MYLTERKCKMISRYIKDANFEETGFSYTLSLISGKYKMIILYCLMEFGAEQKERLTEFGAEQKERFAALGFDVRSDKMPDLKELLERFDQMTKPQLPTNWLMRLTTKRYLRAYPHLQGTHHASLKKEEKKVEEKEEKK